MQVHVQCVCTYIFYSCQPCTKQQDFKGGVCWDELAEICSDILRVAGIQGVARFRGNTVIMMNQIDALNVSGGLSGHTCTI